MHARRHLSRRGGRGGGLTLTLSCLAVLSLIAGCRTAPVVMRPFEGQDFRQLEAGETFTAPVDGPWMSDRYFEWLGAEKIKRDNAQ